MVLASGTTLLNDDGSISLDDDGVELVSDGTSDCDCCESTCTTCNDLPVTLSVSWFAGSWGWTSAFLAPCSPDVNSLTIGGGPCIWTTGGQCVGGATMGGIRIDWYLDIHDVVPSVAVGTSGYVYEVGGPQVTLYFYRATTNPCDVFGTFLYGAQSSFGATATSPPAGVTVAP